jgi:predicted DNA-binding ribbon-helix-helix protein
LTDSAALFKNTPDELVSRLRQRGLSVTSASDSLNQIAQSAKMQPTQLIAELLSERQ